MIGAFVHKVGRFQEKSSSFSLQNANKIVFLAIFHDPFAIKVGHSLRVCSVFEEF